MKEKKKTVQYAIIGIKDFAVRCIIGAYPEERQRPQTLLIDCQVEVEISLAAQDDFLDQTIDYVAISKLAKEIAVSGKYRLLETLCFHVLKELQARFHLHWAAMQVRKPSVFEGKACAFVSLSIGKSKGQ